MERWCITEREYLVLCFITIWCKCSFFHLNYALWAPRSENSAEEVLQLLEQGFPCSSWKKQQGSRYFWAACGGDNARAGCGLWSMHTGTDISWRTEALGEDLCWSRGKMWGRSGRVKLLRTGCKPHSPPACVTWKEGQWVKESGMKKWSWTSFSHDGNW